MQYQRRADGKTVTNSLILSCSSATTPLA